MLQRIQTIFLLLVALCSLALFFLPLAGFLSDLFYLKLYLYAFENMTPDSELQFGILTVLPLLVINGAIILITMITIFSYKERIKQIRLLRIDMLLNMGLLVAIFVFYPYLLLNNIKLDSEFEVGAYIPIINLIFLFLANRFILKDEKLVRSADRLR